MNKLPAAPRLRYVLREEPLPADYMPRKPMDTPELMYQFFRDVAMSDENFETNKEQLVLMLLDTRLKMIGYSVLSLGTLNETTAHPREIFRSVIVSGAYGFVLMHNHPSGDPMPSNADTKFTRRLMEAADLLQLRFIDHVIAGDKRETGFREPYYSYREAGILV